MAKGIASKNSLKALAHPIAQFVSHWGEASKPAKSAGTGTQLPAPYELAALRGEAVLMSRFFNELMAKIPVQLDSEQQIALWHTLVQDGGKITDWVQRLGIAKALRREAVLPQDANQDARKLYTLLLDALNQQAPELLPWAVEAYFWHCWKAQFPTAPEVATVSKTNSKTSAEVLRERLLRALRRKHAVPVELKESFKETENQAESTVQFALLLKRPQHSGWEELVKLERPRLKTARLAAYELALWALK